MGGSIDLRKPQGEKAYQRTEYRLENIENDADNGRANGDYFENLEGDYVRSSLGLNYVFDNRDSNQTPREGHKIDAGINYAGLGGDVNTITFTAAGQKYWNLKWDTILSINGEVGLVDSLDDKDVPIFDRPFLGGARTVRCFQFRDVGHRDAASQETIGCNSMAWASVEYTVPLFD